MDKNDREILRSLAKKVAEGAAKPEQKQKAMLWTAHNDLKTNTPVIFADPENGWNEIIPPRLKCVDAARSMEYELRRKLFYIEEMGDDRVIDEYYDIPWQASDTGWGVSLGQERTSSSGSFKHIPPIVDYEEDFSKIHYPELIIGEVQNKCTQDNFNLAADAFGDILKVRVKRVWWGWSMGLTREYIALRGMDNFFMDLILEPEWVHKTMDLLSKGAIAMLNFLEQEHLLGQNIGNTYVGSGGFGFTDQLKEETPATMKNMWGFCESQETSEVSAEMFAEFILPYHMPILELFGLNCYGCCEALERRWKFIEKIPHLRRVSCSPWSDKEKMAEYLGNKYIMSVKPQPSYLAMPVMEEDAARAEVRKVLDVTKGCNVEFIMKDNHTLGNNPRNITRWVEIVREEIGR